MKIELREVAVFLRAPGRCRAILLHGSDEGLIRHRGAMLTKLVAGAVNDTFRVAELERDCWPRLAAEMSALSMVGGRRVVRVRDATDSILDMLKAALKTAGDNLILLEAPELGRGKLRPFMEGGKETASIACYPEEGRALHETIRTVLAEAGITADGEAITWLAASLGGDRHLLASELEKLALLAADDGRINAEFVRSCVGSSTSATAQSALLAAMAGEVSQADAQVQCALADGMLGVALMRITVSHLQNLHQARLRMAAGLSAQEALRAQRPPVFFKVMGAMLAGLNLWPAEQLMRAIEEARQVEMVCKQTGARQDLLARRFISVLARQARLQVRAAAERVSHGSEVR